jgi:hypothetical protein
VSDSKLKIIFIFVSDKKLSISVFVSEYLYPLISEYEYEYKSEYDRIISDLFAPLVLVLRLHFISSHFHYLFFSNLYQLFFNLI